MTRLKFDKQYIFQKIGTIVFEQKQYPNMQVKFPCNYLVLNNIKKKKELIFVVLGFVMTAQPSWCAETKDFSEVINVYLHMYKLPSLSTFYGCSIAGVK